MPCYPTCRADTPDLASAGDVGGHGVDEARWADQRREQRVGVGKARVAAWGSHRGKGDLHG